MVSILILSTQLWNSAPKPSATAVPRVLGVFLELTKVKLASVSAQSALRTTQTSDRIPALLAALLLFPLGLPSCSTGRPDNSQPAREAAPRTRYQQYFATNQKASPVVTLPRTAIYGKPDSFGLLSDLAVVDDRLVALDSRSALGIAVIDRRDDSISRPPHPGDKLGAATEPAAVSVGDGGDIWVYFNQSGKWASFDLDSPQEGPSRIVDLPQSLSQPLWLGDHIVANGIFAGELLRTYKVENGAGELTAGAGATPFPGVEPDLAIHLNRTRMAARPDGDRLVLAFRYLSRLHVLDARGGLERAFAGPEEVELRYRVADDPREGIHRFVRSADTRLAYLDVTASDDLIFALFCGRRRGDFPETASYGNEIHLFRWDGRFLGVWRLAEDVYRIILDPRRNSLLGLREAPFPAVLEFSLEPLVETVTKPAPAS